MKFSFFKNEVNRILSSNVAIIITIVFLFTDLSFIILHIFATLLPQKEFFYLQNNRGGAEVFQWIKFFWLSIGLFGLTIFARYRNLLPMAIVFTLLCIVDIQDFHNYGSPLFRFISLTFLCLTGYLSITYSARKSIRKFEKELIYGFRTLLVLFGFCIVLLDTIGELVGYLSNSNFLYYQILTLIEESIEMILASIVFSFFISNVIFHFDKDLLKSNSHFYFNDRNIND